MKTPATRIKAEKYLLIMIISLVPGWYTARAKANLRPYTIENDWVWNTFMGSSSDDRGRSIAVDKSGNVYVAGYGSSWGSPVNEHAGWVDAFAAKLNSSGELLWHTYMGGSEYDDFGMSIAVDNDGNVYVTGNSDASWGSPINPYAGGYYDVFAVKLDSNGVSVWNTFIGSSSDDRGRSIAVDGNGNVYITGYSDATWGSPVIAHAGKNDAFAVKLDSSGAMLWNTFMGSSSWDEGRSIAVDNSGNVYIAGKSNTAWGAPLNAHNGNSDAFAAKLNSSGALQWNTFMGSSYPDEGNGIAIDAGGNVFIAGFSEYAGWGSPVNPHSDGFSDAFVAKLDNAGVMQWNTFMGSSDHDAANSIALDGQGNVYIAGDSKLTWGTPVNVFVGEEQEDAFAAKLNSDGKRIWNTFMGGASWDYGKGIAVDENNYVYISGESYVYTWGTPVNPHAGWNNDVFAVKIDYTDITDVETEKAIPAITLSQNYPNPFTDNTLIVYSLARADQVTLKLYDIHGREIRTLVNQFQQPGKFAIEFDASQLSGGMYLYGLKIGKSGVIMKKMTIIE